MLISFDEAQRFIRLQERLRNATFHELKKDGRHKSSEGSLSITFSLPPVVGDEKEPTWTVEAYSYLLNPDGRLANWSGKTPSEVIGKAEDAIKDWCFRSEMEQFEGRYQLIVKDEDGEEVAL